MIRRNHNNNQSIDRAQLLANSRRQTIQTGQIVITEEDKQILLRMEWEMYELQLKLKKVTICLQVLHQGDEQYNRFSQEKVKLQTRLKDLQIYHRRMTGVKEQQFSPQIEQKWKTASRRVQQKQKSEQIIKSQYLPHQIREKLQKLSQSRKQWHDQSSLILQHQAQSKNSLVIENQKDTLIQFDLNNQKIHQNQEKTEQQYEKKDEQQKQLQEKLIEAKHRSRIAEIQLRLAQQNIRNNRRNTLQNQLKFLQSRQIWGLYLCQYNNGKKFTPPI